MLFSILFVFSGLKILLAGCSLGCIAGSIAVTAALPKLLAKMYLVGKGKIAPIELYSGRLLAASVILCAVSVVFPYIACINTVKKLSPIECLKHEEKITISRRRSRLLSGNGVTGIAWRNFTRNRKRMAVTVGSLFLGIELLLPGGVRIIINPWKWGTADR